MKEKRENKERKKEGKKERKKEKNTYILIAREVFVALAVQARMIKSEKYRISWTNCLHYKTLRNYEASDSL